MKGRGCIYTLLVPVCPWDSWLSCKKGPNASRGSNMPLFQGVRPSFCISGAPHGVIEGGECPKMKGRGCIYTLLVPVCKWDSWFSCKKGPNASTGVQYAYIPGDAVEFQHIRGSQRCERRVKAPLNERQRMHLHTADACLQLGQLVKLQKGSKCEYGCPLCLYSRGSGPVSAYPGLPTV